jgi:hypothetical protein
MRGSILYVVLCHKVRHKRQVSCQQRPCSQCQNTLGQSVVGHAGTGGGVTPEARTPRARPPPLSTPTLLGLVHVLVMLSLLSRFFGPVWVQYVYSRDLPISLRIALSVPCGQHDVLLSRVISLLHRYRAVQLVPALSLCACWRNSEFCSLSVADVPAMVCVLLYLVESDAQLLR